MLLSFPFLLAAVLLAIIPDPVLLMLQPGQCQGERLKVFLLHLVLR
jgi:hypothetical protein